MGKEGSRGGVRVCGIEVSGYQVCRKVLPSELLRGGLMALYELLRRHSGCCQDSTFSSEPSV